MNDSQYLQIQLTTVMASIKPHEDNMKKDALLLNANLNINATMAVDSNLNNDMTEAELTPLVLPYSKVSIDDCEFTFNDATFSEESEGDTILKNKSLKSENTKQSVENLTVSFEEAIEVVGTGCFQYYVIAIGGVILFASCVAAGSMAFILQPAQCDLEMDSSMKGQLASANVFGLIISCHLMGFLSDTLGRRYMLIRCLFAEGALYLITSLAPNHYTTIVILRLFNGIASCGSIVSVFAYVGEFQVSKFRTTAILSCSFIMTVLFAILPGLAWIIIPLDISIEIYPGLLFRSWRLFYALTAIPSLFAMSLLYFQPESPKFLLAKGDSKGAIHVLKTMYYKNKGENTFKITALKISNCETVAKLGDTSSKVIAFLNLMWNQTVPLFKVPHRRNLILLSSALSLAFYSNSALYVWMTEVIDGIAIVHQEMNVTTGTMCDVMSYKKHVSKRIITHSVYNMTSEFNTLTKNMTQSNEVFGCRDNVDVSVYSNYMYITVLQMFNWVGIIYLERLIKKKYVLLGLTLLTISAQLSMLFPYRLELIPLTAIVSLIGSGSLLPILNSVIVDLFPTNLRAMASCLSLMFFRVGTILGYSITGILIDNHCNILIISFITASVGCFIITIFLPMKADFTKDQNNKDAS